MTVMSLPLALPLPIDAHLADIAAAAARGAVIVKASPGAGKTTRVPRALLDVVAGKIVVLEPRRLAARLSAERVAAERGEPVGEKVGYQVRFEAKASLRTRVLFVTEGVFLRIVMDRPDLAGIDALVLDEFHERHIHTDLALALARRLQATTRPDLKLVVMSATLDTAALEAYLPDARVFDVPGRAFPVATEYLPALEGQDVERAVGEAVRQMLADARCAGHVLVFLTGAQEIRRCEAHLTRLLGGAVDVLPLAADLPARDQARVFAESGRRKVILATNVAETSVTIPGVTGVIDTGRAKIAAHASWSGMPTLDVKRVSQASCIQRAGRAGRTAAGVAYRLFSESDYLGRPPFTVPDIRRLDFAETYLAVAALAPTLAAPGPIEQALPWLELPDPKAVESARQLLEYLGALDREGAITARGAKLAKLPMHPRLAAIVVRGIERGVGPHALLAACLVGEGMILSRGGGAFAVEDSDVAFQMDLLTRLARRETVSPHGLADAIDAGRVRQVTHIFESLARRLDLCGSLAALGDVDHEALAECLLAGFPDRVAAKRELAPKDKGQGREQHLFNFCLGRGGILSETSVVRAAPLIVVLDASESQAKSADRGTTIWVASEVRPEQLGLSPAPLLSARRETLWADDAERVDVFERTLYGQIVVAAKRAAVRPEDSPVVEELLRRKLAERWPKPFADDGDLATYHARIGLLLARDKALALPRFEGEMLELLQAAICDGKRGFREIAARSLRDYIEEQLPSDLVDRLRRETPLELRLANGRTLRVTYEAGRPPFVSGYIQDFFGVKATPALMRGEVPLTVHLLGPNKRPVQVTSDLPGFWQRVYPGLLTELGRNYPRHFWPSDPTAAAPQLHKPRGR